MKNQIYPTDLSDRQWHCIKDLLAAAKVACRSFAVDMRQVINAILSILMSGAQWRMLPKDYPKWKSVYHYFRIWPAKCAAPSFPPVTSTGRETSNRATTVVQQQPLVGRRQLGIGKRAAQAAQCQQDRQPIAVAQQVDIRTDRAGHH